MRTDHLPERFALFTVLVNSVTLLDFMDDALEKFDWKDFSEYRLKLVSS